MQITVFSFFMAVFWSSIIIILLYFFRKKSIFVRQFGVSSLIVLYFFCIIRTLFPFEFSFTQVISVSRIYNPIYAALYTKFFSFGQVSVSVKEIFVILWISVSLFLLLRFAIQYKRYIKAFSSLKTTENKEITDIFEKVKSESEHKVNIDIICSTQLENPMGIGIFKKRILIPYNDYQGEQLYYILRHEYAHFLNKDLIVKMLVRIFCYLFWWNPFAYLLCKDLDQILEIKCDLTVTEFMNAQDRIAYLSTIVSILKQSSIKDKKPVPVSSAAFFGNKKKSSLEERFTYVSKGSISKRRATSIRIGSILIACLVMLLSYSFVFQSQYEAPLKEIEANSGAEVVDPDDIYIAVDDNGNYIAVLPDGSTYPVENYDRDQYEKDGFKIIEGEY